MRAVSMLLVFCLSAPALASDYKIQVELLIVKGTRSVRTDAARRVPDGGEAIDLAESASFVPGDRLEIDYPKLRVYMLDNRGNRLVAECMDCTPERPLRLVIGNPDQKLPFQQTQGRITYSVKPVEKGWFETLLKFIEGPKEKIVPVAVRGTLFVLESSGGKFTASLAKGGIDVGVKGTANFYQVEPGYAVSGRPEGFAPTRADPGLLKQAKRMTSRPHIHKWKGMKPGKPLKVPKPPSFLKAWGPWLTMGAGVVSLAAGGITHGLAISERDSAVNTARQTYTIERCGREKTFEVANKTAAQQYDDDYQDRVAPLKTTTWVLYGVGATAVAGGLLWMLLSDAPAALSPARVSPAFSAEAWSLDLEWRF